MDVICLVGFWILCGIIAAAIYQNKGRAAAWGFLVGLLLGPLGILYAAVRSTRQETLDSRALAKGTMKRCPYCGELIKREASICKYCHSTLSI